MKKLYLYPQTQVVECWPESKLLLLSFDDNPPEPTAPLRQVSGTSVKLTTLYI